MKRDPDQFQPNDWHSTTLLPSLRNALDALPFPFCVVNADNYTVEFANSTASCSQQLDEVTCFKLLHQRAEPCAQAEHPCPLQEIKDTKKPVIMEHLHISQDGSPQNVEVHSYPILDCAGEVSHMIEFTQDISERKQFEEALRESETNWRALVENSPDHILMLDNELKIQFANFASPGLTVESLTGTPLYNYVEQGQEHIKAILQGVLETGAPAQYETIYHAPDGSDIYYETFVTPRRLTGSDQITGLTLGARDITKRVQMDAEKQALTHALGERVKELGCLYNISKLIMTPDISMDEILQGAVNLMPPSWQYPEITCARVVLDGREFKTANHQISPWQQSAEITIQGKVSGFIEVGYLEEMAEIAEGPFLKEERNLIDAIAERLGRTAERLRTEERIHHHELQLAALEERERIGRELHDNLSQVIGYLGAQSQAARTHLEQGDVQNVQAILDQLIEITNNAQTEVRQYILGIRDSARQSGDRDHGFLAVLEDLLANLLSRHGLKTQLSLPDGWLDNTLAPEVETQLLRIIQEALLNVARHAGVNKARLLFTRHAEEVQVIISDEGCGFQTTGILQDSVDEDRKHFGLAIIRERAQGIGGRLEIRSAPGEGTSVIVRIPRALVQTQDEVGQGIRVLLVDDHPLYLEGLRSLLAARGFNVIGTAQDGFLAQSLAQTLRPDLILMDVNMPRCDGLEATRKIKEALPDTKIVILTVDAEQETLFTALKYGASGYLLKSLEGKQFFTLLANVLEGEITLSPDMATLALAEFSQPEAKISRDPAESIVLTRRQKEVLRLTAQGLSNKEISQKLHITEATVKYHVSKILERLHLKSRYQLAAYTPLRTGSSSSGSG